MRLGAQKIAQQTITILTGATSGVSSIISANEGVYCGMLRVLKVNAPYWHNNVTIDHLAIVDEDGDTIYDYTTGIARGAQTTGTVTIITGLLVPIIKKEYFSATLSGSPGTASGATERATILIVGYITNELV